MPYKLDTMLCIFSWTLLCFKLIQSLNTWLCGYSPRKKSNCKTNCLSYSGLDWRSQHFPSSLERFFMFTAKRQAQQHVVHHSMLEIGTIIEYLIMSPLYLERNVCTRPTVSTTVGWISALSISPHHGRLFLSVA